MEIKEFTPEIIQNIIDNRIEKIIISSTYNSPLPILPDTIKIIIFGDRDIDFVNTPYNKIKLWNDGIINFNHPINCLPKYLTHLVFLDYCEFNHPVNNLPSTLEFMSLSGYFNHPLNNLPTNLKYLSLVLEKYDYDLDNLPNGIKHLKLHFNKYNGDFDSLPQELEYLYINGYYKKKLDSLPNNLKYLDCEYFHSNVLNVIDNLPNSLEQLSVVDNVLLETLPNSIKILKIDKYYKGTLDLIPNSIEELVLRGQENINFSVLPKSIIKLTLRLCNNYNVNNIIQLYNLKSLHILDYRNNIKEIDYLPDSLEYLEIYEEILINNFPPNLKSILTKKTNKYIDDYLNIKPDLVIIFYKEIKDTNFPNILKEIMEIDENFELL